MVLSGSKSSSDYTQYGSLGFPSSSKHLLCVMFCFLNKSNSPQREKKTTRYYWEHATGSDTGPRRVWFWVCVGSGRGLSGVKASCATSHQWDLRQVLYPLCASVSSPGNWGRHYHLLHGIYNTCKVAGTRASTKQDAPQCWLLLSLPQLLVISEGERTAKPSPRTIQGGCS